MISSDGRYVAFDSYAENLIPGDSNYECDIFVSDRLAGTVVPLPGDFDGDGVDIDDLLLLAQVYGTIEGQTGFESRFDLNGDKVVDIYDLIIVARQLR